MVRTFCIYNWVSKKFCRGQTFGFCIFSTKGLVWNLGFPYYIHYVETFIDLLLYLYIRGAGVKIVYVLRVCMVKTRPHAPRRGTAVSVGAGRQQTDIDPLSSVSFEIFLIRVTFLLYAQVFVAAAS